MGRLICYFDFIFWEPLDLGSAFYFVSLYLGEIAIQLLTISAYLMPTPACSWSPHETTPKPETCGSCGTTKQLWTGGWVRAEVFSVIFQVKYPWVLHAQANHRKERATYLREILLQAALVPKLCVEESVSPSNRTVLEISWKGAIRLWA